MGRYHNTYSVGVSHESDLRWSDKLRIMPSPKWIYDFNEAVAFARMKAKNTGEPMDVFKQVDFPDGCHELFFDVVTRKTKQREVVLL